MQPKVPDVCIGVERHKTDLAIIWHPKVPTCKNMDHSDQYSSYSFKAMEFPVHPRTLLMCLMCFDPHWLVDHLWTHKATKERTNSAESIAGLPPCIHSRWARMVTRRMFYKQIAVCWSSFPWESTQIGCEQQVHSSFLREFQQLKQPSQATAWNFDPISEALLRHISESSEAPQLDLETCLTLPWGKASLCGSLPGCTWTKHLPASSQGCGGGRIAISRHRVAIARRHNSISCRARKCRLWSETFRFSKLVPIRAVPFCSFIPMEMIRNDTWSFWSYLISSYLFISLQCLTLFEAPTKSAPRRRRRRVAPREEPAEPEVKAQWTAVRTRHFRHLFFGETVIE